MPRYLPGHGMSHLVSHHTCQVALLIHCCCREMVLCPLDRLLEHPHSGEDRKSRHCHSPFPRGYHSIVPALDHHNTFEEYIDTFSKLHQDETTIVDTSGEFHSKRYLQLTIGSNKRRSLLVIKDHRHCATNRIYKAKSGVSRKVGVENERRS